MVDLPLYITKSSPRPNRQQARTNRIQDSNASHEETDYVVVGVVPMVNATHPAAGEVEARQTEGHEQSHGQSAKEPSGKSIDPVQCHSAILMYCDPRSQIKSSVCYAP